MRAHVHICTRVYAIINQARYCATCAWALATACDHPTGRLIGLHAAGLRVNSRAMFMRPFSLVLVAVLLAGCASTTVRARSRNQVPLACGLCPVTRIPWWPLTCGKPMVVRGFEWSLFRGLW